MSAPQLVPRSPRGGVIAVWALGAVLSIAIGIVAPVGARAVWLAVGLGACLVVAFGIQIAYARAQGFLVRVAASVLGALVVMGLVSAGFGLAALAVA